MDFVKVLEEHMGLDEVDVVGVLERDGILLTGSVALNIDNSGPGTYLLVEKVEVQNGVVRVGEDGGHVFYDVVLPNKVSIEEISKMSAIEFISNLIKLR
ncbi:hypothetical protein D3C77_458110 [compost metagenome]